MNKAIPTEVVPKDILSLPIDRGAWKKSDQNRFDAWFSTLPKDCVIAAPESPAFREAWMERLGIDATMEAVKQEPVLQFFAYSHLPDHLKAVSQPFSEMAFKIERELPRNPERTVALRKLLEAKDCAVRALLYK